MLGQIFLKRKWQRFHIWYLCHLYIFCSLYYRRIFPTGTPSPVRLSPGPPCPSSALCPRRSASLRGVSGSVIFIICVLEEKSIGFRKKFKKLNKIQNKIELQAICSNQETKIRRQKEKGRNRKIWSYLGACTAKSNFLASILYWGYETYNSVLAEHLWPCFYD